jgi:hypothetical protein
VIDLAKKIMLVDVKAYGHQFPAYRDNPIAETIRAVAGSGGKSYAERYATFLRDMVYSDERPDRRCYEESRGPDSSSEVKRLVTPQDRITQYQEELAAAVSVFFDPTPIL